MPGTEAIRILVADDHPLIRLGLRSLVEVEPGMEVLAEAANGAEALQLYRVHEPDVVLIDLRMPGVDGISATRLILKEYPDARIIALTTYDGDEDIHRALSAGARGYLLKDMLRTELLAAVRRVNGGERYIPPAVASRLAEYIPHVDLTPREVEVLTLMAQGHSNREIAVALGRSESTMKIHVKNILTKFKVSDRTAAVTTAIRRGFLRLG